MALVDIQLNSKDFDTITKKVYDVCGITLNETKFEMVRRRLTSRLKALGLSSIEQYLGYLDAHNAEEEPFFINAITTNFTSFFRENHHFDYLDKVLIPHWLKEKKHIRQLRIWSAGCSSGEEPYTIAMILDKYKEQLSSWDIKILATDIDTNILSKAKEGEYLKEKNQNLDKTIVRQHFQCSHYDKTKYIRVKDSLKQNITFKRLNFLEPWPMKKQYDLIFCRNVIIYFDNTTQESIIQQFQDLQATGGTLFIGHSESLYRMSTQYDLIGKAIYQKAK